MKNKIPRSLFLLIALQGILICSYSSAQNVGVGTATPSEKLDVLGNLKFSGALMPNNLPGNSGQILTSQGAGIPPIWKDIDSVADVRTFTTNAQLIGNPGGIIYAVLPGLTYTFTVPAGKNHKLFISAYGTCSKTASNNADNQAQYELFVDGVATGFVQRVSIGDEISFYWNTPWAISGVVALTAGSHTIDVRASHATSLAPSIFLCQAVGFVGQATMNLVIIRD